MFDSAENLLISETFKQNGWKKYNSSSTSNAQTTYLCSLLYALVAFLETVNAFSSFQNLQHKDLNVSFPMDLCDMCEPLYCTK